MGERANTEEGRRWIQTAVVRMDRTAHDLLLRQQDVEATGARWDKVRDDDAPIALPEVPPNFIPILESEQVQNPFGSDIDVNPSELAPEVEPAQGNRDLGMDIDVIM